MLHIASFVVAVNQPRLTRPGTGKQALPSSLLDFAKPIQDVVAEIYQLHACVGDVRKNDYAKEFCIQACKQLQTLGLVQRESEKAD